MTNVATTVSVKIPPQVLKRIPAAGHGRSGFILQAIEEKLMRQQRVEWKPTTERGHKLAALLAKGKKERYPLLNDEQFEQELRERRGRNF